MVLIFSDKIDLKRIKQGYSLNGNLNNKIVELNNKTLIYLEKNLFQIGVEKITFSSKNEFSFNLDENFKISNEIYFLKLMLKNF